MIRWNSVFACGAWGEKIQECQEQRMQEHSNRSVLEHSRSQWVENPRQRERERERERDKRARNPRDSQAKLFLPQSRSEILQMIRETRVFTELEVDLTKLPQLNKRARWIARRKPD